MPSKDHQDQDCYGNGPALGTDSIGIELTAVSKGYGTELYLPRDAGGGVGQEGWCHSEKNWNEKPKRYIVGQIKTMQQVYQ